MTHTELVLVDEAALPSARRSPARSRWLAVGIAMVLASGWWVTSSCSAGTAVTASVRSGIVLVTTTA